MMIGVPSGSPGLVPTIGNALVGLPNAEAEHVAAVGPGTEIGTTALAYSGPGVLQGVSYGLTPGPQASTTGAADPSGEQALTTAAAHPLGAADHAPLDGALAKPVHTAEARPDERALADSEWLTRVVNRVGNWFARPAPDDPELDPAVAPEPITLARDDLLCDAGQVEPAGLGAPLGAIVVSALALRLRQPVRRWLRRDWGQTFSRKSGARPHGSVPSKGTEEVPPGPIAVRVRFRRRDELDGVVDGRDRVAQLGGEVSLTDLFWLLIAIAAMLGERR